MAKKSGSDAGAGRGLRPHRLPGSPGTVRGPSDGAVACSKEIEFDREAANQRILFAMLLLDAPAVVAQDAGSGQPSASSEAPQRQSRRSRSLRRLLPRQRRGRRAAGPALDQRLGAVESKLAGTERTVEAIQSSVTVSRS